MLIHSKRFSLLYLWRVFLWWMELHLQLHISNKCNPFVGINLKRLIQTRYLGRGNLYSRRASTRLACWHVCGRTFLIDKSWYVVLSLVRQSWPVQEKQLKVRLCTSKWSVFFCLHCFSSSLQRPVLSFHVGFLPWWTVTCKSNKSFPSISLLSSVLYHCNVK